MKKFKEVLYEIRFFFYGGLLGLVYSIVMTMLGLTAIAFMLYMVTLLVLIIIVFPLIYILDSKFVRSPKTI